MSAGIVAMLPAPFEARARSLCAQIEREFGVTNSAEITPPHVTFHVAKAYRQEQLQSALDTWAKTATPCPIRTWGIGVFGGEQPIVFIGVTRTQPLSILHQSVFSLAQAHAVDHEPIFEPVTWEPHITLASEGVSAENVGSIVSYLNKKPLTWQITINAISLIHSEHDDHTIVHTCAW